MPKEIERKFLVKGNDYRSFVKSVKINQGYVSQQADCVVRVRVQDDNAYLTLKGRQKGITRDEFEYEIPISEAKEILKTLCLGGRVEKIRYEGEVNKRIWVVDEFLGDNLGLVLAEIELDSEDEEIQLPEWIEREVSHDFRYSNAELSKRPYKTWEAK